MRKKRCSYCKEPIANSKFSKLCKKCLALMEVKKINDFKCEPPKSCFCCPYPDCICELKYRTHEEGQYLKCAGLKK